MPDQQPITAVCRCEPEKVGARDYFVWSDGDDKTFVDGVTDIYLTEAEVVLERKGRPSSVFRRDHVYMVTCESCSPPPVG